MFAKILFGFYVFFTIDGYVCDPIHEVVNDASADTTDEPVGEPLFLTPYIENNKTSEAKRLSLVQHLPNAPNIESYSGFLTIDKRFNSHMFFWFFPSFKNPKNAPIIVWLEGGPGTSSTWIMFELVGPFKVDKNLTVTLRPDSWVEEFSMLYIDNPVGTGFSNTADEKGYCNDENCVSDNLYEFLQQFYTIFSEYKGNDMYFSGLSYAGKYIPAIGYKLMEKRNEIDFNFKGISAGNGMTDPIHQIDYSKFLHDVGLIDGKEEREMKNKTEKCKQFIANKEYMKGMDCFVEIIGMFMNMTGFESYFNILSARPWGAYESERYINDNRTLNAIHVGRTEFNRHSDVVYHHLYEDFTKSVMPNLTALIDANYKVLLFAGNLDIIVGVPSMNGMLGNPDWKYYSSLDSSERVVWRVDPNDAEVAGYVKSFGNFTYVVVRNAGHASPQQQPRACLDMMKRFINGQAFG